MDAESADDPASFQFAAAEPDEPAMTVITAVAEIKGVRLTDLEPLNDVIDPDALSALFSGEGGAFRRGERGTVPSGLTLTFRYVGCDVTVQQGRVRVRCA